MRIVLASSSPRRRELLAALVDGFGVTPADIPEPPIVDMINDTRAVALAKAEHVFARAPHSLVLGADTVVHDGTRSYGKPANAEEATAMLNALRGRKHNVVTAVAFASDAGTVVEHSQAEVVLGALADAQVEAYVASSRPLDKAGGYAIQDEDVPTVAGLLGCYCSVVGLPLWRVRRMLVAAGLGARRPDLTYDRCASCPEREDEPL